MKLNIVKSINIHDFVIIFVLVLIKTVVILL